MKELNTFEGNPLIHSPKSILEGSLVHGQALGYGLKVSRFGRLLTVEDERGVRTAFKGAANARTSTTGADFCIDKSATKALLMSKGIPTAPGIKLHSRDTKGLERFIDRHGWPVVVKPLRGGGGKGVTANIKDAEALEAAIEFASAPAGFLIEKHVVGADYRFLVYRDDVLGVWVRDAANVVGNGKSHVNDLIDAKNEIRRSNPHLASRPIEKSEQVKEHLRVSGRNLDYIPASGEKVYLRSAANLSSGGDHIDVTDQAHPSLREIAVLAGKAIPGIDLLGVDLLVENIEKPASQQKVNVCEVNSSPGISAHDFPMYGQPQSVSLNYFRMTADSEGLNILDYRESGRYRITFSGQFSAQRMDSLTAKYADLLDLRIESGIHGSTNYQIYASGTAMSVATMCSRFATVMTRGVAIGSIDTERIY